MELRVLEPVDLELLAQIDRSEVVETGYRVEDGRLVAFAVHWDVPAWDPVGDGEHSVRAMVEHWAPQAVAGGVLRGAFDGDTVAAIAMVVPAFEPGLALLALLYVSRPYRRRGLAATLWECAETDAREAGARELYVSSVPSGSAVGFYLSRGCRLASHPHPELYAAEPEDIHLVKTL